MISRTSNRPLGRCAHQASPAAVNCPTRASACRSVSKPITAQVSLGGGSASLGRRLDQAQVQVARGAPTFRSGWNLRPQSLVQQIGNFGQVLRLVTTWPASSWLCASDPDRRRTCLQGIVPRWPTKSAYPKLAKLVLAKLPQVELIRPSIATVNRRVSFLLRSKRLKLLRRDPDILAPSLAQPFDAFG